MSHIINIEKASLENKNFRKVIYTSHYMQLVLMSIPPKGQIGTETHGVDQFIKIESGEGKAIIEGKETKVSDGFSINIVAGTKHNIVNTGKEDLKIYTLYALPHHKKGKIHKTKKDADADKSDEFDGKTDLK